MDRRFLGIWSAPYVGFVVVLLSAALTSNACSARGRPPSMQSPPGPVISGSIARPGTTQPAGQTQPDHQRQPPSGSTEPNSPIAADGAAVTTSQEQPVGTAYTVEITQRPSTNAPSAELARGDPRQTNPLHQQAPGFWPVAFAGAVGLLAWVGWRRFKKRATDPPSSRA